MLFDGLNPFRKVLRGLTGTYRGSTVSVRTAVTVANLTSGSTTTDADSFATASVSPAANKLQILSVVSGVTSGSGNTPTVTGCGLTWVAIANSAQLTRKVTVFRALGPTPSAGVLTIDFAAQSQASIAWSLNEFTGMDTSGTNGSGAIVQNVQTTSAAQGTTISTDLASLENALNIHLCSIGIASNSAITPDADFTELSDGPGVATIALNCEVEYAANQTNCTATIPNVAVVTCSIEVKAGAT